MRRRKRLFFLSTLQLGNGKSLLGVFSTVIYTCIRLESRLAVRRKEHRSPYEVGFSVGKWSEKENTAFQVKYVQFRSQGF